MTNLEPVKMSIPAVQQHKAIFGVRTYRTNKQAAQNGFRYGKACVFTVMEHLKVKVKVMSAPWITEINNVASVHNVTFTQRLQALMKGLSKDVILYWKSILSREIIFQSKKLFQKVTAGEVHFIWGTMHWKYSYTQSQRYTILYISMMGSVSWKHIQYEAAHTVHSRTFIHWCWAGIQGQTVEVP